MDNPNEYDDDAFTEASNELQGNLVEMFDALWGAGASVRDIESEVANAIDNSEFGGSGDTRVQISIR